MTHEMTHVWLVYSLDPYGYSPIELGGIFASEEAATKYVIYRALRWLAAR